MKPDAVLLASESTFETRAVLKACLLADVPVARVDLADLHLHAQGLAGGTTLPIGSVEYVREGMRVAGLAEPENLSYHPSIRPHLGRPVFPWRTGELLRIPIPRPIFVKPQVTKLFTGFVLDPQKTDDQYNEHDLAQLQALRLLDADEPLWTSPVVNFISEWRYYVMDGKVIGQARYDDGQEHAPAPTQAFVDQACKAAWIALNHPFALDIGVVSTPNKNEVVELNDAWAIGLYGQGTLSATNYLLMLHTRWQSLPRLTPVDAA